jgi:DNA-binding transcriptional MerR regulator
VERVQSDDGLVIRLFNETPKQVKETERKLRDEGVSNQEISEIFEHLHTGKNADFWREVQE